jgi:hypothetical protein
MYIKLHQHERIVRGFDVSMYIKLHQHERIVRGFDVSMYIKLHEHERIVRGFGSRLRRGLCQAFVGGRLGCHGGSGSRQTP